MPTRVLFLIPYPLDESPSQRFRFEQYFDLLKENNIEFYVQPFLASNNWRTFFKTGNYFAKLLALSLGILKRLKILSKVRGYEFIFVHREIAPIGPPFFEWFIAKILKKKIIFDFDDAIWLTDRKNESRILRLLKWRSKVKTICKWAYKVSCGNLFLCNFAKQYNRNVVYNPTTIDTDGMHNPAFYPSTRKSTRKLTIGWTGSHSTLKYLSDVEDVLASIKKKYDVEFVIIADRQPSLKVDSRFVAWCTSTEMVDLMQFDIGIMPLPDDIWSKGKCGFKALQYMALEIPTIASPIGVNSEIIEHGENGFLAYSQEDWITHLDLLISNPEKRVEIGTKARQKVVADYSKRSNAVNFLSLFT